MFTTCISSLDLPSFLVNITLENSMSCVINPLAGGGTQEEFHFIFGQPKESFSKNLMKGITHEDEPSTLFESKIYVHLLILIGGIALELLNIVTLVVGYMVIFGLVFCYFGFIALLRYNIRGEPLTMNRIYIIYFEAKVILSLAR